MRFKIKIESNDYIDKALHYHNRLALEENSDAFNKMIPHYKSMMDTGLIDDVLMQEMQKAKHQFSTETVPHTFTMMLREGFTAQYGFVLLNNKLLDVMAEFLANKNIVEVGAGSGFLSSQLQAKNLDIIPVDAHDLSTSHYGFNHFHTNIIIEDAVQHLQKNHYDTVIMSWPCYDSPFAHNVLKNMQVGQQLIYIGEGCGGCTADDAFFDLLDTKAIANEQFTDKLSAYSLSFPGIHDRWQVYDIVS